MKNFGFYTEWDGESYAEELVTEERQPVSHVWLFATPWTVAYQGPLSSQFSRQEHWSR